MYRAKPENFAHNKQIIINRIKCVCIFMCYSRLTYSLQTKGLANVTLKWTTFLVQVKPLILVGVINCYFLAFFFFTFLFSYNLFYSLIFSFK